MATGTGFSPQCYPPRMTRAQAIARRTAGTLKENCVVVITDGPVIGAAPNTSPTEIELNPTSPTALGQTARVFTTFDNSPWAGLYDIDLGVDGSIYELKDNQGNIVRDIDADSPTVHTQFPWGNTQWRDNYAEDTVFTSPQVVAPFTVTNSRFINTTMDFTGTTTGFILDTEVKGSGTHHIQGSFPLWNRSVIDNATVNCGPGAGITLSGAEVVDITTSISTTGLGTITITNSRVEDGAIILNQGAVAANSITVTNSDVRDNAQLQNDLGSRKSIQINRSTIEDAAIIRGQAGTVNRSVLVSQSTVRSNTLLVRDDAGGNITGCDLLNSPITVDGNVASALQFSDSKIVDTTITHGAAATNCQWNGNELIGCLVDIQGPGNGGFSVNLRNNLLINTRIRTTAGATGQLSINQTNADGGTVPFGTIAIGADSPRDLLLDGGNVVTGPFSIIQTGTTQTTAGGPKGDRVTTCTVQGGDILFASTVGETIGHIIADCLVIGGPNAPGVPDGRILIDGTSARVLVFACEVWGDLHITDAPEGALQGPTDMYDNYIGSGSSLVYNGGDGVEKQIRNNRIEGLSHIFCTGLTGAAGGVLADVFASRVANQSILNVNGARVVGFPVRNVIVENQATLTVDPGGSALEVRVAQQANVTTGAFNQFVVEVSGAFVVALTASNINTLKNKGFSDVV